MLLELLMSGALGHCRSPGASSDQPLRGGACFTKIGNALCQVELILIAITATALPSRG
jgi:hypothetical protein